MLNNKPVVLTPIFLIILFIAPIFLAWFCYAHTNFLPRKTTNNGQLVTPPVSISELQIFDSDNALQRNPFQIYKGKWLLLFLSSGNCGVSCQKQLFYLRQIQLALGKDVNRLQRVILTDRATPVDPSLESLLRGPFAGTSHWLINRLEWNRIISRQAVIYLVDPMGNIMMTYSTNSNAEAIHKDLQHLLRVSKIG